MTVIRAVAATPANKDFTKTKKHQVFHSGADCYDVLRMTCRFLRSNCETCVYCYYCSDMLWGDRLVWHWYL